MTNLWKRAEGQSLVEFALVLLFIILPVTIGIADGSILFYKYVVVTNAAREGARAGAVYQGPSFPAGSDTCSNVLQVDGFREPIILTTMQTLAAPLVTVDDWGVSYVPDPPCLGWQGQNCVRCDPYRSGDALTVTITHTHTTIAGLVIGLKEINLTASATMRTEPGGAAPTPP